MSEVYAATKWEQFDGNQDSIFRLSLKIDVPQKDFKVKVKYAYHG